MQSEDTDSKKFVARFAAALSWLKEFVHEEDVNEFGDDIVDPSGDGYDATESDIKPELELGFRLPGADEMPAQMTYGELTELLEETKKSAIVNQVECWTERRALFRVETRSAGEGWARFDHLEKNRRFCECKTADGRVVSLSIVSGLTPFTFHVVKSGDYNADYNPSYSDHECFIEASWKGKRPEQNSVRDVVRALIFNISVYLKCSLQVTPRQIIEDYDYEDFYTPFGDRFPDLLIGEGMGAVIHLFNRAEASDDPEFRIVGFVKVLEHVSESVLRENLIRTVVAKLGSPRVLQPDDKFVFELEAMFSEQKGARKDREALRLTVTKCCDAFELAPHSPSFLKLASLDPSHSDPKDRGVALDQFSSCLTSTRNQISHAKLNYSPMGDECPEGDIAKLADCARMAAHQAILWYSSLNESMRVK